MVEAQEQGRVEQRQPGHPFFSSSASEIPRSDPYAAPDRGPHFLPVIFGVRGTADQAKAPLCRRAGDRDIPNRCFRRAGSAPYPSARRSPHQQSGEAMSRPGRNWRVILALFCCAFLALAPALAEARAGGSFGGRPSSMGSRGIAQLGEQRRAAAEPQPDPAARPVRLRIRADLPRFRRQPFSAPSVSDRARRRAVRLLAVRARRQCRDRRRRGIGDRRPAVDCDHRFLDLAGVPLLPPRVRIVGLARRRRASRLARPERRRRRPFATVAATSTSPMPIFNRSSSCMRRSRKPGAPAISRAWGG